MHRARLWVSLLSIFGPETERPAEGRPVVELIGLAIVCLEFSKSVINVVSVIERPGKVFMGVSCSTAVDFVHLLKEAPGRVRIA